MKKKILNQLNDNTLNDEQLNDIDQVEVLE